MICKACWEEAQKRMPERVADAYHALIREREGELELIRKHREIRSHALDMSAPYPGWVDFLLDYIDNHYGMTDKAEPTPLRQCIEEQDFSSPEEKVAVMAELNLIDQTQLHLHAALVSLKQAHQAAKAAKLPYDQIDAAIQRAEIAWAIVDPFHGICEPLEKE